MSYEIVRITHPVLRSNLQWVGGRSGVGLDSRDAFALCYEGTERWVAAFDWEEYCAPFEDQLVWEEAAVALFGAQQDVYALDLETGAVKLHLHIAWHFGYFALTPSRDRLLILGGQDIHALDPELRVLWTAKDVAIDGITLLDITESSLDVSAEMDPPGGWESVSIDLQTGQELGRASRPFG